MDFLWFKALHIIFVIAWYAGLFYIFRLFVYHVKYFDKPEMAQAYSLMERKLLYIIMMPAMVLTFLFGFLMLTQVPLVLTKTWFIVKMGAVLVLLAYQIYAVHIHNSLADGVKPLSERACRIINEVPTVMLFLIVIMAVIKPS